MISRVLPIALAFALLAQLVAAQESRESRPASRPAAESRGFSLRDLIDTGRDVVDAVKGDQLTDAAEHALLREGLQFKKEGRHQSALRCFERLRESKFYSTSAVIMIVSVHYDLGELDEAARVAEEFAAQLHQGSDETIAWWLVASTNEKRRNWAKAVAAWERMSPSSDPMSSMTMSPVKRLLGIARCRFHLGEIDVALKLLERCFFEEGAMGRFYPGGPRVASSIVVAYAEYAGRGGRLTQAKNFAATLPEEIRTLCFESIKVVEAWLSRDAAALLRVVANSDLDDEQIAAAGRLMVELGTPAIELLAQRIGAGDVKSIKLAGSSGSRDLLAPLEKRYAINGPDNDAVIDAIQRLEAVESRPVSRPAK